MSEEIKYGTEFLDKLKDDIHDLFDGNKQLKADLQEANDNTIWWHNRWQSEHKQLEELKNINEKLSLALDSSEKRNDKAIEYIEKSKEDNWNIDLNDLLEILKGSDKE